MSSSIRKALNDHLHIAARIRDEFYLEDEETLADTILGETYLDEVIAATLREAFIREAKADGLGDLITKMLRRQDWLKVTAEGLRNAALWATQEVGWKKIEAPDFTATISVPKHGRVIITSEADLPAAYVRSKTTTAPDKTAIGEAIKRGETVPGAEFGNPQPSWRIRT